MDLDKIGYTDKEVLRKKYKGLIEELLPSNKELKDCVIKFYEKDGLEGCLNFLEKIDINKIIENRKKELKKEFFKEITTIIDITETFVSAFYHLKQYGDISEEFYLKAKEFYLKNEEFRKSFKFDYPENKGKMERYISIGMKLWHCFPEFFEL